MLGYFLAILIGLSLGLLGGGGSILTVPILVYAVGMDAKTSIALSLAIVGITSLIGIWSHYKNKNIDFKVASIFTPVAMIGTFLGAKLSQLISGQTQLILFAIIMIIASFFMLKEKKEQANEEDDHQEKKLNYSLIALEGIVVGIITGLVGVGGGFLIVPALALLTGLSMKKAIGTSLIIISLKSFAGFAGYIGIVEIPWNFLFTFTFFSAIGIIIGSILVKYISQKALKKSFAIFLIIMGVFIIYKNKDTLLGENSTEAKQKTNQEQALKKISELQKKLQRELMQAMKVSKSDALEVCNLKAIDLTHETWSDGIKVGRVSLKNRNPENTPKDWMKETIHQYNKKELKNEYKLIKINNELQGIIKPIHTMPQCLQCHGENIDKNFYSEIKSLYPNDKAIDHKVGDIRGFFWAEF